MLVDVVFAQRYFDALNGYFHPGDHPKPSRSWNGVFKWANNRAPIIVQHMLAGVSTHILLDLGLAATTVAPGAALPALQEDFDRINAVLASQVNGVVADINELSPLLANLYAVLADREICLINESITVMRDSAWQFATSLNRTPPLFRQLRIRIRDTAVAAQVEVSANYLLLGLGAPIIAAIAATESRDIGHNIGVLNEIASTPAPITTTI